MGGVDNAIEDAPRKDGFEQRQILFWSRSAQSGRSTWMRLAFTISMGEHRPSVTISRNADADIETPKRSDTHGLCEQPKSARNLL